MYPHKKQRSHNTAFRCNGKHFRSVYRTIRYARKRNRSANRPFLYGVESIRSVNRTFFYGWNSECSICRTFRGRLNPNVRYVLMIPHSFNFEVWKYRTHKHTLKLNVRYTDQKWAPLCLKLRYNEHQDALFFRGCRVLGVFLFLLLPL